MRIDKYLTYLKENYHPKMFSTIDELRDYQNCKHCSIEDATDDFVSNNDDYKIILFDDCRDFNEGSLPSDEFYFELYIKYDHLSKVIISYIGQGQPCTATNILDKKIKKSIA